MATKPEKQIIQEKTPEAPAVIEGESREIDGEELALPIAENMPEPSPSALNTPEEAATPAQAAPGAPPVVSPVIPEQPANVPQVKDSEGVQFDPTIHRTDDAGNPRVSPTTGKFLKKYKAGTATTSAPASPGVQTSVASSPSGPDQFDNGAEMLLQTGYGVAASFLTNDIRPESAEEHASLKIPLAAVLRERGSLGMTPTQLLMLSLAAYIGKKAAKPTVKERLIYIYLKARAFIKGEKAPQEIPKIEPAN